VTGVQTCALPISSSMEMSDGVHGENRRVGTGSIVDTPDTDV
jgi:hypothetical protein